MTSSDKTQPPHNQMDFLQSNRGVSEAIGYALVFGTVLTIILGLSIAAGTAITSQQGDDALRGAENSFTQLNDEIYQVQKGLNFSFWEVEMPGGSYSQLDSTKIEIDDTTSTAPISLETQPIEYQDESGAELFYESQFILTSTDGQSYTVAETQPHLYQTANSINQETLTLTLTRLQTEDQKPASMGLSKTRTVFWGINFIGDTKKRTFEASSTTITIQTENLRQWETYLNHLDRTGKLEFTSINVNAGSNEIVADIDGSNLDTITIRSNLLELSMMTS